MSGIITLLVFSGLTVNLTNYQNLDNNQGIIEKNNTIEENIVENKVAKEISLYNNPYEDKYEPNDNISTATEILPNDFYKRDSYTVNIDATLDYTALTQDIDYYYLTIFTDSNLRVDINSNLDYASNFEFSLMKYNYYKISDGHAYHWPEDVFSNYDGVKNISYETLLNPGTYLIYLRGCQDENNSADLSYSMELNISKKNHSEDILVTDLTKNKDVLGSVWISDFLPCNNNSIFDITSEFIYYREDTTNLHYPDYALDKMMEISNGEPIRLATFYIWDKLLKGTLNKLMIATRDCYLDAVKEKNKKIIKFELQENSITKGLEIVAIVAGNTFVPKPISIPVKILSKLGITTIKKYYDAIIPEITINDVFFANYIGSLITAFDLGIGEIKDKDIEYIEQYGSNQIIQIPIYYNLGVKEYNVSTKNEHYYSLKASSLECSYMKTLYYNDTFFFGKQTNDFYCNGKIYEINNYEDLYDCSKLKLAHSHDHVYEGHYCIYCNKYTSAHDYDKNYIWINSTKHSAECDCGAVANQPHIVEKGSNRCLLCGGKADMGFIKFNNKSTNIIQITNNGSYTLPNGVIVLVPEDKKMYFNNYLLFTDKSKFDNILIN